MPSSTPNQPNSDLQEAIERNAKALKGTQAHEHLHHLLHTSGKHDISPQMEEAMETIEKIARAKKG